MQDRDKQVAANIIDLTGVDHYSPKTLELCASFIREHREEAVADATAPLVEDLYKAYQEFRLNIMNSKPSNDCTASNVDKLANANLALCVSSQLWEHLMKALAAHKQRRGEK